MQAMIEKNYEEYSLYAVYVLWRICIICSIWFGQINVDRSCSVIWSIVGAVCPAWSSGVDNACSSQYFDSLFAYSLLGCFWDARLGTFYFPLLFMRLGWRFQCVDAAVNWPVIHFIHVNRCLEAEFEWFCWFWCCFQFSIALPENWNGVEIFKGRSLCVSITMDLK